jgi:hypothetical protein
VAVGAQGQTATGERVPEGSPGFRRYAYLPKSLTGFGLVIVPQWLVHRALDQRREALAAQVEVQLGRLERQSKSDLDHVTNPEVRELETVLRTLRSERTWVHATSFSGVSVLVGQLALPCISLVVSVLLARSRA